jgi:hypothetical protein
MTILPSGLEYCHGNHQTEKLQLSKLDISPWPIVAGQEVSIAVSGELVRKLKNGAQVLINLDIHGKEVLPYVYDICGMLKENSNYTGGVECTINPFKFNFTYPSMIPATSPPVNFGIKIDVLNGPIVNGTAKGQRLICVKGNVEIHNPKFVKPYCGDGNIGNEICLRENECCSPWGYCGSTDHYCTGAPAAINSIQLLRKIEFPKIDLKDIKFPDGIRIPQIPDVEDIKSQVPEVPDVEDIKNQIPKIPEIDLENLESRVPEGIKIRKEMLEDVKSKLPEKEDIQEKLPEIPEEVLEDIQENMPEIPEVKEVDVLKVKLEDVKVPAGARLPELP